MHRPRNDVNLAIPRPSWQSLLTMLRFLGRFSYRLYIIALVVVVAALALFRPITTAIAAQVLPSPVGPQPWLAGEPEHVAAEFPHYDGSMGNGDIYVIPDGNRRAGLVVFLGANAVPSTTDGGNMADDAVAPGQGRIVERVMVWDDLTSGRGGILCQPIKRYSPASPPALTFSAASRSSAICAYRWNWF